MSAFLAAAATDMTPYVSWQLDRRESASSQQCTARKAQHTVCCKHSSGRSLGHIDLCPVHTPDPLRVLRNARSRRFGCQHSSGVAHRLQRCVEEVGDHAAYVWCTLPGALILCALRARVCPA